jgi:hypothetical protein
MTSDKRRFSRIFFNVEALLTVDEFVYMVGRIANLSVGGCLLEIEEGFALGSACKFTLPLPGIYPGVEVFGEVIRVGHGEVGLRFTLIDPESLFHLQNIIRHNTADSDAVEEEISAHPGLR